MEKKSSDEGTEDLAKKDQSNNDPVEPSFEKIEERFVQMLPDAIVEFGVDEERKAAKEQKELFMLEHGYAPDEDPERARLRLELRRTSNKLKSDEDTREMRRKFAGRIYLVSSCWLGGIFAILILQGFHFEGFYLTDTVLAALIGATGGIGLLAIILRNLFPNDEKIPKE